MAPKMAFFSLEPTGQSIIVAPLIWVERVIGLAILILQVVELATPVVILVKDMRELEPELMIQLDGMPITVAVEVLGIVVMIVDWLKEVGVEVTEHQEATGLIPTQVT
jgi:hypothetical protein